MSDPIKEMIGLNETELNQHLNLALYIIWKSYICTEIRGWASGREFGEQTDESLGKKQVAQLPEDYRAEVEGC